MLWDEEGVEGNEETKLSPFNATEPKVILIIQ